MLLLLLIKDFLLFIAGEGAGLLLAGGATHLAGKPDIGKRYLVLICFGYQEWCSPYSRCLSYLFVNFGGFAFRYQLATVALYQIYHRTHPIDLITKRIMPLGKVFTEMLGFLHCRLI
jgi:hypothetical protein